MQTHYHPKDGAIESYGQIAVYSEYSLDTINDLSNDTSGWIISKGNMKWLLNADKNHSKWESVLHGARAWSYRGDDIKDQIIFNRVGRTSEFKVIRIKYEGYSATAEVRKLKGAELQEFLMQSGFANACKVVIGFHEREQFAFPERSEDARAAIKGFTAAAEFILDNQRGHGGK